MWKMNKIMKVILWVLGSLLTLLLLLFLYVLIVSRVDPPKVSASVFETMERQQPSTGFYTLGNSWLRKSKNGLYEMYTEGAPYDRGLVAGKLGKELIQRQESHFQEQIRKLVPNQAWLHTLKYFVGWFNRGLAKNVTPEYQQEIYGISRSASPEFSYVGDAYPRILNYHAAHDIGHALQSMMLVGCTSFATWGKRSQDGELIIGRNFDFWAGDKFAEDKIINFEHPSDGYRFMSVTWGGFIGVVSGMNEKGLTVTINAARSDIPSGSATPVSLVAREILQYASNIAEAKAIAGKRKMFVSESFLVGSQADHRAVLIEKTPKGLDMYDPGGDELLCTNHFQGKPLAEDASNQIQLIQSASLYRYHRLREMLDSTPVNSVARTVEILRDRRGKQGRDIGTGNEKAVNQLIAHHSIVFEPGKLRVWVSTSPWQLGSYQAYDLNKVFGLAGMKEDREIADSALAIAADPFLSEEAYRRFVLFRGIRQRAQDGQPIDGDSAVMLNPEYYEAYRIAGEDAYRSGRYARAIELFQQGLKKEIATQGELLRMEGRMMQCMEKMKKQR